MRMLLSLIIGGWGARLKADPPMMTISPKSLSQFKIISRTRNSCRAFWLHKRQNRTPHAGFGFALYLKELSSSLRIT